MNQALSGKKIMILVGNGVDEAAMSSVQREMLKTGATLTTVGIEPGLVNSWNDNAWGLYFPVDVQINRALGSDYDCLIVPAGERGVAKLATNPHAERILSSFMDAHKPVAMMADAFKLFEAVGLADKQDNANVYAGAADDMADFIAGMVAHFMDEEADMKVAA